jgi:galactonate dehydratase
MNDKQDLGVGILKHPFVIENGYIDVPKAPGLGIDIDDDALRTMQFDGNWETPKLFYEDGSLADW